MMSAKYSLAICTANNLMQEHPSHQASQWYNSEDKGQLGPTNAEQKFLNFPLKLLRQI
jgi:hypothetical protein